MKLVLTILIALVFMVGIYFYMDSKIQTMEDIFHAELLKCNTDTRAAEILADRYHKSYIMAIDSIYVLLNREPLIVTDTVIKIETPSENGVIWMKRRVQDSDSTVLRPYWIHEF